MNKQLTLLSTSLIVCSSLSAAWTTIGLPDRSSFNTTAMTHLSDGRLVYAHDGSIYQQTSFGNAGLSSYSNAPSGAYSFVSSNGFVGVGSFGAAAPVYGFDPLNTGAAFNSTGSIQSYHGVAYQAGSVLVVGTNSGGGTSEVGHYNGGAYTTLVSDVSTFSGGIALDGSGNLYVVDNDDLNIYSYTSAQVASAVGGSVLGLGDGALVTNLGVSGSIAVDSQGRIFATGYQKSGIQVYDPNTDESGSIVPNDLNTNYTVGTFSDGVDDYVGWLNWAGYSAGDAVTYGYDLDGNIPVPEPTTYALLAGLLALGAALRRRV